MNIGFIRGVVISVTEGLIKLFSATGRTDESFEQREYFQHYGYTSRPLEGAEVIIIREGNHILAIASDDRRYRIGLENGEVAIYTDEGDNIHLKRNKIIEVNSGNKIIANATNEVDVNTKKAVVNATNEADVNTKVAKIAASTSADITSPEITLNGTDITITASALAYLKGNGVYLGPASAEKHYLMDSRLAAWLTSHTHSSDGSPPSQSLPQCYTNNTMAS